MKLKDFYATRTSGPGGAHLGSALFGYRSNMLMAPVDKAGGSGGGGGGDGGGSGGDGQPTQKPAPEGGDKSDDDDDDDAGGGGDEKLYSKADLERIVKERVDRANRNKSGERQKPSKQAETKKQKAEPESSTWLLDFTDALDEVVEETGVEVSRKLKIRMRNEFAREQPDDPHAWVTNYLDDIGLSKQKPDTSSQNNNSQKSDDGAKMKKQSEAPPSSDKGGANSTPTDYEAKLSSDPLNLSKTDVARILEKHGEAKGCELIRDSVNRALSKIKLVADPRRKAS